MIKSRLQLKVVSIVAVTLAVGFFLLVFMSARKGAEDLYDANLEKAEALTSSVITSLEWSMRSGSQEPVRGLLSSLRGIEGVGEIRVFGPAGDELYAEHGYTQPDEAVLTGVREAVSTGRAGSITTGDSLVYLRPLGNEQECTGCHTAGQKVLGLVSVVVPLEGVQARIDNNRMWSVLNAVFVISVVIVILHFWMKRVVVTPIKAAMGVMDSMDRDKDLTSRMAAGSSDEMGRLSRSFNGFIDTVQGMMQRLNRMGYQVGSISAQVAVNSSRVFEGAQLQARSVESMSGSIEQMNASIREVAESANSLSSSAESTSSSIIEMVASMDQIAGSTAVLSSSVESTVASLTEISASLGQVSNSVGILSGAADKGVGYINEIAASIKEVEGAAKESARLSEEVTKEASNLGMDAMTRAIAGMKKISSSVDQSGDVINRLGSRSRQIGEILDVIDEVTDQTELLSLNAAILASQAGEHGKGFAVVADEIKDLAERTAASTQEITRLIATVQAETAEAVVSMDAGREAVEEGEAVVYEAKQMLEEIIGMSVRSSEMSKLIEKATTEQSRDAGKVSEAMQNVSDMVKQIMSAIKELSYGSDQIMREAVKVRDVSDQVRMATSEQSKGSDQIITAVENVNDQVQHIARATGEQRAGSEEFMRSMERISDVAMRNEDLAEEMNAAVDELTRHVGELKSEVDSYRVSARGTEILKLGVVPLEGPAQMYKKFLPLSKFLSDKLGREVVFKLTTSFSETVKDVGTGAVDICYMTPTTYIEAHDKYGVGLLAKALRDGMPFSHTIIAVKEDSPIMRLEDLKGKSFAFGDEMSTSSYLVPRYMLEKGGVPLSSLKEYRFLGHHDDVAQAVILGEFDAGGLRETTAYQFKGKGLRFLKVSDDIPEFNFCARPGLEENLRNEISAALEELAQKSDEYKEVLSAIDKDYTGFMKARDSDYDRIREMMKMF